MQSLFSRMILAAMLGACLSSHLAAQQPAGKCHIILLDVSGSMKQRYAGGLKDWLIRPLLTSAAFAPNDRVIVRWFDHRGNSAFQANDPQRRFDGTLDAQAILNQVATWDQAVGANTNMPEGVNLALGDIKNLQVQGDVLIWMLTDNVQDVGGPGDANQLYQGIKDNESFRAAYLFPLVKEKNGQPPPESAMVLYLLHYSEQPTRFRLDGVAESAARKIDNPRITWFPLETGLDINENNITVNDEPAMIVDGKLKLPAVPEGTTPDFTLRFPFSSRIRGRKIVSSQIKHQKATLENLPSSVEAQGDASLWDVDISPKNLTIEPSKNSEINYTTSLRAPDLTLRPAGFWNALINSYSDSVDLSFQFTLEDVETRIESPEVSRVKNLQEIENNLRPSQKNIRSRRFPLSFQVQYNSLWRRALVAGLALIICLAVAGVALALASKSAYEISSPFGEQVMKLPMVGRDYITINGDRAAVVSKTPGKMTVAPLGAYTLNGGLAAQRLTASADNSFTIENQTDGRRFPYSLRRLVKHRNTAAPDDHSWDV